MPSLGDVVTQFRANIGPYMQQLRVMSGGNREYLAQIDDMERELMTNDTLVRQMASGYTKVGSGAKTARAGLGAVRSSLMTLTARLVGVNGSLGTFLGGLSQFALGNLASLGILAGVAAIALAIRKLGDRARESRKEMQQFIDDMKKGIVNVQVLTKEGELGVARHQVELLKEAVKGMEDLGRAQAAAAREAAASRRMGVVTAGGTEPPDEFVFSEEQQQLIDQWRIALQNANATVVTLEESLRRAADAADKTLAEKGLASAAKAAAQFQKLLDEVTEGSVRMFIDSMTAARRRTQEYREELDKFVVTIRGQVRTAGEEFISIVMRLQEAVVAGRLGLQEYMEMVRRLAEEFAEIEDPADEAAKKVEKLTDALERLFNRLTRGGGLDILSALSGALFGFIRTGGNPLGAAAGAAGGLFGIPGLDRLVKSRAEGLQGSTTPKIGRVHGLAGLTPKPRNFGGVAQGSSITIEVAPTVNPFVAATNAEWMSVIAETNRALARTGHRIQVAQ